MKCCARTHLSHGLEEVDTIRLGADVVVNVSAGVVSLQEPVEAVSHELEVWVAKVLHAYDAWVAQRSHALREVCVVFGQSKEAEAQRGAIEAREGGSKCAGGGMKGLVRARESSIGQAGGGRGQGRGGKGKRKKKNNKERHGLALPCERLTGCARSDGGSWWGREGRTHCESRGKT